MGNGAVTNGKGCPGLELDIEGKIEPNPKLLLVFTDSQHTVCPRGVTQSLRTRPTMAGAGVQLSVAEPRGYRRKAGKQGALRVDFFVMHMYSHSFYLHGLECCFDVSEGCAGHVAFM